MKQMLKQTLALLLSVVMLLSLCVTGASAEGSVTSAEALKSAIGAGGEIVLGSDITLTEKLTISKNLTINGNGNTITGNSDDVGVYFEITNGEVTVTNMTLTGFGDTAATATGTGVFKIPSTANDSAKLTATDLTIKKFNRAAFDIRTGSFDIQNCTIDCNNGAANQLTKGLVAGYEAEKTVSGNVKGCTISGVNSNYEGWSASGIEVSCGATVTVEDTEITSMKGGISIARNYGHDKALVTVKNCTIDASDYALRIFESNKALDPVAGTSAQLNVQGGSYTGNIRVSIGDGKTADTKSVISISGGTFSDASVFKYLAEDASIKLGADMTLTEKLTISKNLTIDGNGKTITGVANSNDVYFEITTGTVCIKNATITGFGSTAGTDSGVAVFKIPSNCSNINFTADNLTVNNFCRSAFDIRSGEFAITNCKINCNNDNANKLTKAILAGLGTATVTGTIDSCTITNTDNTYADWSTAGIEVYAPADVTVSNCSIKDVEDGIIADIYWADSNADVAVVVDNTTIKAADHSLRVNGNKDEQGNNIANITVTSGEYTGELDTQNYNAHCIIDIVAGTFSVDPTAYLDPAFEAVSAGTTYCVQPKTDNIFAAILHDKAATNPIADAELYTTAPAATSSVKNGVVEVKLSATGLKAHKNGQDNLGHWIGFALTAPTDATQMKCAFNTTEAGLATLSDLTAVEANVTADNKSGVAFYANTSDTTPKTWARVQWFDASSNALTAPITYHMDLSGVSVSIDTTNLSPAILHDNAVTDPIADSALCDGTFTATPSVKNGVVEVNLRAANLKEHTNGSSASGKWIGFALTAPTGATQMKCAFNTTAEDVATLSGLTAVEANVTADNKSGVAFYANASDTTPKTWARVQWFDASSNALTAPITYHMNIDISPIPSSSSGSSAPVKDATTVAAAGKTQTTATEAKLVVDDTKLDKAVTAAKEGASVVVTVPEGKAVASAQVALQSVESMAAKEMVLSVKVGNTSYEMPTAAVDTKAVLAQLGATETAAAPVSVTISITKADATVQAEVEAAATKAGAEIIGTPTAFEVTASFQDKSVNISRFDKYVQRLIEVTAEQAQRVTTAIVHEDDDSLRHVPTRINQQDGKWFVTISSRTNSTYALIANKVSFADAQGTWYESFVNELASRKVIDGVTAERFDGDRDITRAEFTAILVRALGLPADGDSSMFSDIPANAWYAGAVGAAYESGLVLGCGNGKFEPTHPMLRQDIMLMLRQAARLAEYPLDLLNARDLAKEFKDLDSVSDYAAEAMYWNLNNNFITGSYGRVQPLANISRAECATAILNLLQQVGLIDE